MTEKKCKTDEEATDYLAGFTGRTVVEAAQHIKARAGIDTAYESARWDARLCYYCDRPCAVWTVPRILPLCDEHGTVSPNPALDDAEERMWRYATRWEREEFLAP